MQRSGIDGTQVAPNAKPNIFSGFEDPSGVQQNQQPRFTAVSGVDDPSGVQKNQPPRFTTQIT